MGLLHSKVIRDERKISRDRFFIVAHATEMETCKLFAITAMHGNEIIKIHETNYYTSYIILRGIEETNRK